MTPVGVCEHGRINLHCEDCAYERALERGHAMPERPKPEKSPEPYVADEDLLIDTGRGVEVLVAAGDPVPAKLLDRPRRARVPGEQKKPPAGARRRPG